jgi:FdhD protein
MTTVHSTKILKIRSDKSFAKNDLIVSEEPLEIRLGHGSQSDRQQMTLLVTMRTPGNDEELCLGFLYGENIINGLEDVLSIKYCGDVDRVEEKENVMRVELAPSVEIKPEQFQRNFYTTSSCGVCGKASIDAIKINCTPVSSTLPILEASYFYPLPDSLQEAQEVFKYTGGLHAAAIFDSRGEIVFHREDVGRHNALDKLIGRLINSDVDTSASVLLLSGRVSFELVQKAVRIGFPIIAAIGAPSSLAVNLAEEFGVTLIGFLKADGFNVYTHPERLNDIV